MCQTIDPREVLVYLNELGYTNITASQLKDFIKDLKKLIKHDLRRNSDLEYTGSSYTSSRSRYAECDSSSNSRVFEEKSSNTFNSGTSNYKQTISSKEKEVPKREKQISVHIQKKHSQINHIHCVHVDESNFTMPKEYHSKNVSVHEPIKATSSDPSRTDVTTTGTTESTIKSIHPSSKPSMASKPSCMSEKKPSFIRPVSLKSKTSMINKCDPVALYHFYQTEWKKVTIPGQDSRADLRWAIREKMLGEPKPELHKCCRKKSVSHRR